MGSDFVCLCHASTTHAQRGLEFSHEFICAYFKLRRNASEHKTQTFESILWLQFQMHLRRYHFYVPGGIGGFAV